VRVPATFTIRGGALSPQTVSSPAFLAIELSLASGDDAQHHVVVRTPASRSLTVPARGRAAILIGGLRAGRYPIYVDGAARGALIVGGDPGP
jgi:hypothetical protein